MCRLLRSVFFFSCAVVLCSSHCAPPDPPSIPLSPCCLCFTLHHHFVFTPQRLEQFVASQHPHPHLTVFLFVTFSSLTPLLLTFFLSVSIGGHGLGKPTEHLQNASRNSSNPRFSLRMVGGGTGFRSDLISPHLSSRVARLQSFNSAVFVLPPSRLLVEFNSHNRFSHLLLYGIKELTD